MRDRFHIVLYLALLSFGAAANAQKPDPLVLSGNVNLGGKVTPYLIRNLPVSSFPELPAGVANALTAMNCLIPQTYEAKRPENVIHASFESPGSQDWAALCASQGKVSLLIFFASAAADKPIVLKAIAETDRLQEHDASGQLGFNWGIDPASPSRVHDAQAGMAHRPPLLDHDCLADTIVDRKTIYRLYRNGEWERVDVD